MLSKWWPRGGRCARFAVARSTALATSARAPMGMPCRLFYEPDIVSLTLSEDQALEILRRGRIEEKGLLPYSSNHSFLVLVHEDERSVPAVYKPQRGENPLWDFEWGTLCKREAA